MCGRFTLRTPTKDIVKAFGLTDAPDLKPRFNIAPNQQVAAIKLDPNTGTRQLSMFRWGLVPSWADDPSIGYKMINARAESVAGKTFAMGPPAISSDMMASMDEQSPKPRRRWLSFSLRSLMPSIFRKEATRWTRQNYQPTTSTNSCRFQD